MFPTFYLSQGDAGVPPEAVMLLLHFDGTDGQTTTVDSSTYGRTIGLNASELSNVQAKFGTTSWTATGGYAHIAISEYTGGAFRIDASDWCMEAWVRHGSGDFGDGLLFTIGHPDLLERFNVVFTTLDNIVVRQYSGGSVLWSIAGTFATNTWQHIAVVRQSGKVKFYVQGVLQGESAQDAYLCPDTSPQFEVAGSLGNQYDFPSGYIDEARFVQGYPVYTAAFTPPSAPFPDP